MGHVLKVCRVVESGACSGGSEGVYVHVELWKVGHVLGEVKVCRYMYSCEKWRN